MDKIPKDLGIKIGTKEESIWTSVLREAENLIEGSERNIVIQLAIRDLAKDKIKLEVSK